MVNQKCDANFYGAEDTGDTRQTTGFFEFTAKVLDVIGNHKNGATYRQLNRNLPNRGDWLNEAIDTLLLSGKIHNTGGVCISRFIIGGEAIKPLPKLSKSDYTAGIKQVHEWRKTHF